MAEAELRVRVHYDFASTLCYVAHRVMARLDPLVDDLGIALDWTPVDLTALVAGFRRGAPVEPVRRANAARVARELGVRVHVPAAWPDSRAVGSAVLLAAHAGREAGYRERAFSAGFEAARPVEDAAGACALARDLGLALDPAEVERGVAELEVRTARAREEEVTGVPTFMLGRWPFGGIQSEDTMRHVLARWARRQRAGELA